MTRFMRLFICLIFGFTVALPALAQDVAQSSDFKNRFLTALEDDPDTNTVDAVATGPYFGSYPPQIYSIIEELRREHAQLLDDKDIRATLTKLQNEHALTGVRFIAEWALAGTEKFERDSIAINKTRNYCSAEDVGAKDLPALPDHVRDLLAPQQEELFMDLEGVSTRKTRPLTKVDIHAERLSEGWLTGYGQGSFGLHYIPDDEARPTQPLIPGDIHAILPTPCDKTFYVFSTYDWPNRRRQCNVPLVIWKIREKAPGSFVISTYRKLPDRFGSVSQMENGDLFLFFGGPTRTGCYGAGMPIERPAYSNNPPIGFSRDGRIYAVCDGPLE